MLFVYLALFAVVLIEGAVFIMWPRFCMGYIESVSVRCPYNVRHLWLVRLGSVAFIVMASCQLTTILALGSLASNEISRPAWAVATLWLLVLGAATVSLVVFAYLMGHTLRLRRHTCDLAPVVA